MGYKVLIHSKMISPNKHTFAAILLALSLFGACKSAETLPSDQVSVGLNKAARVRADITVRVDTIQDSRCPKGVNCIWQGQAFVSTLISAKNAQQRVQLYTNPFPGTNQPNSADITLDGQTYKVILRGVYAVDPNNDQSEKQAIIQVTKR